MTAKILFVDDEPNVLEGIRRQLRRQFELETATGGEEGLKILTERGPFGVVVSDMRMPGMNGAQFLVRAREMSPDTVRMILSGHAELQSTIAAVNDGNIFRFLTKPCPAETLSRVLETGLSQYRLVIAERELLEKTLTGAVKALTEVLSLVNPAAFSRTSRVQHYAEGIAETIGLADRWEVRLAAMLSQIGCVTLPPDTLGKIEAGQELSEDESRMYESHPEVAAKLLSSIPRLGRVASMVSRQAFRVEAADLPEDPLQWDPETLGALILGVATEFDRLVTHGCSPESALEKLKSRENPAPPAVIDALGAVPQAESEMSSRMVTIAELKVSMILDEDVMTKTGIRLMPKGQEVTATVVARLWNFANGVGIVEPFRVLVPV